MSPRVIYVTELAANEVSAAALFEP